MAFSFRGIWKLVWATPAFPFYSEIVKRIGDNLGKFNFRLDDEQGNTPPLTKGISSSTQLIHLPNISSTCSSSTSALLSIVYDSKSHFCCRRKHGTASWLPNWIPSRRGRWWEMGVATSSTAEMRNTFTARHNNKVCISSQSWNELLNWLDQGI